MEEEAASRLERPLVLAWVLTAAGILAAGLILYLARGALAPAIERWLPEPKEEPPVVEELVPTPPIPVDEPTAPEWTFGDIEAAVTPLSELVAGLIAEGRDELPEFADLDSNDPVRVARMRNRWQPWGVIWRNRLGVLQRRMPPEEECRRHAALEPICDVLLRSFAALEDPRSRPNR